MKFEKADDQISGGHAFRVLNAYVNWLEPRGFRAWLRRLFSQSERETQKHGKRAVAVLRLMGLFDRPADARCLAALRREPIPGLTEPLDGLADDDWEFCLSGLEAAKLFTVNRDASGALVSLDAHPHIREYFARELRAPTGRNKPGQDNALGLAAKHDSASPVGAAQEAGVPPLQGSGILGGQGTWGVAPGWHGTPRWG